MVEKYTVLKTRGNHVVALRATHIRDVETLPWPKVDSPDSQRVIILYGNWL